ncbi:MAG: hypothetical protein KDA96_07350 [Planctomycetaceae bacterium]|nr:hypothetical protein [Planctomycetaceae bacterium]
MAQTVPRPLRQPPVRVCRRWLPALLAMVAVLGYFTTKSSIGDEVSVAEQPPEQPMLRGYVVGRLWHTAVQPEHYHQFVGSVRKQMGIEQNGPRLISMGSFRGTSTAGQGIAGIGTQLNRGLLSILQPGIKRPSGAKRPTLKGTVFFLSTEPDIQLEQIPFEAVGSREEFEKRIRAMVSGPGLVRELIGQDDRFEIRTQFNQTPASPPANEDGKDSGQPEIKSLSIVISNARGVSGDQLMMTSPVTGFSTYYRYVDGIAYVSQMKAIHHLNLPGSRELQLSEEDSRHDVFADFDFTTVPEAIKGTFRNALEASASTALQRLDSESEADHSLRQALGQGRLELVKAFLFDVDRIRIAVSFPDDETPSVTGSLRVTARENSSLARSLEIAGQGSGRLMSLVDEESPLAIATAVQLPEWSRPFIRNVVSAFQLQLKDRTQDPGVSLLIDDLFQPVHDSLSRGELDCAVAVRGNVEDGLVVVGGLRLSDAERFLSSAESLIAVRANDLPFEMRHFDMDGYSAISLHNRQISGPIEGEPLPMQINLCAVDSWLWVTAGELSETDTGAVEALRELVARTGSQESIGAPTFPLQVQMKLNRWLGDTDRPVSQLPQKAIRAAEKTLQDMSRPRLQVWFDDQPVDAVVQGDSSQSKSFAAKLLSPENSDLKFTVRTEGRELFADASVGMGLIRLIVAQQVEGQSVMQGTIRVLPKLQGGSSVQRIQLNIGGPPANNKE